MIVDLASSTVDGRKVMPRVCQLAEMLKHGRKVRARRIIGNMYAHCEHPLVALRLTALLARRAGIPVKAKAGRPVGAFKGGCSPGGLYWIA